MSDHSSFTDIVQASKTLAARWSELARKAITDARAQGVILEPEDVLNLREVRNATLGAELDEEAYQRELLALPALSDVARKKAIAAGDEDARAATVAELNKITADAPAGRHTDASARKMSRARDMGVASVPVTAEDRDEKLRMLQDVDDHQTRLWLARKWELL
ncbi:MULTISPECIES: hypothetical protein [unclassified Sulfitobacter]|uniref:hypothetical protein n=1 Tax=unclassified Sulfitobacter TaxID=196795 RepID=UPI003747038C